MIKLIDENTDISQLKMRKFEWDIVVGRENTPYEVIDIEGYVHSIGGKWGENSLWCYPRNESPNYDNLLEYSGNGGADWGIIMSTHNYVKCKYGESELRTKKNVMITRNGEEFYLTHGINNALHLIDVINEHPIEFNNYNFEKKLIGRKVWWRSQPGIITSWIGHGQACVIIEPDNIPAFQVPAEFKDEDIFYEGCEDVKTDIFDKHIWWFRK